jgi:glycosyltransferase involved in cell wall biosynthesis
LRVNVGDDVKILWIPHAGWHIPQRAHLFCRALAERHEVHVTDWVADFSSLRDYFSSRYLRNFVYRRYRDGNITVHGIPRFSPALYVSALRRLNTAVFSKLVQRIIERYRIDVVVSTFVVPPPKAPRLVFDLFDDNVAYWRTFGRVMGYADEIEKTELAYLEAADAVVAVSSVLVEKVNATGAHGIVHHIPNGVDLRRFGNSNRENIRTQLRVQDPLVGIVGNHDRPAELNKVLDAIGFLANQDLDFLIAGRGSAVLGAKRRVCSEGLSNIRFLGYLPLEQAIGVISALDVGLCAYAKTPGADASSPMRLLMYTAAGIPTVCTDLEEVRRMQFPNVVLVRDNAESLAEGIRHALHLPQRRPSQIEAYDLQSIVRRYETVLAGTLE